MNRQPVDLDQASVAILYEKAFDLVEEKRFAEARPILEECLRQNPGRSLAIPVRQELARVLQVLGDREGALRLRMEVKRLAPDRHANLWKLAQLLAELGHGDEALREAIEASRLQPSNPRYTELVTRLRQMITPCRSRGLFAWLRRLFARLISGTKNPQLYQAVRAGDLAAAKALVEQGANPNAAWQGRTLLSAGAATGNRRMVEILLELGADPNKAAQWHVTPLMLAAMAGHKEVMAILLKAGADVNAKRDTGSTALLEAISCPQEETPKLLIEAGADPNVCGANGITPLAMATHNNQTELVRLLVARGADVNARNASGGTALLEACKRGNLEMASLLLDAGADPTLPLSDGRTPLMAAKYWGHDAVAALLEEHLDRKLVGYVFLSWTTNSPRDNSATRLIKQALDKCDIGYFDFTKHPVDDSTDQTEAIMANLQEQVRKCDCSIEIISSEILGRDWVQDERDLLFGRGKPRLFVCLEEHYMLAVSDRGEKDVIRLNFSDGRIGVRGDSLLQDACNDVYYRSTEFYEKCLRLGGLLRKALETGDWHDLRGDKEFAGRIE